MFCFELTTKSLRQGNEFACGNEATQNKDVNNIIKVHREVKIVRFMGQWKPVSKLPLQAVNETHKLAVRAVFN